MQERFLVSGKAGSGKTPLVLQKYSRIVEEHKEDNVIFILPTHILTKQTIWQARHHFSINNHYEY